MGPDVADYFGRYKSVPGWFYEQDFRLFDFLLSSQAGGDLVEIGAYQGASAILLGLHTRPDETLTVCDLFGMPEDDAPNREESELLYGDLSRESFEHNYLSVLPKLPTILQTSSLEILEHVRPATCRFVHIDGSHLYDFVRSDIQAARTMLKPDGIVALDDWRQPHTPGVNVAVMEQVVARELHPIAITGGKFYGSWNDSLALAQRNAVMNWVAAVPRLKLHVEPVRGEEWPRIAMSGPPETKRTIPQRALTRLQRELHRYRTN